MSDLGTRVPSYRVETTTVSLSVFDVVGVDGDEHGFICHAGLAEASGSQASGEVALLDMGPPLHGFESKNRMRANAVGHADLTDDEEWKIKTFIHRHASEHQAFLQVRQAQLLRIAPQMYCIYPHAAPLCENDGRYVRMRFSCAGFVLEAYKTARISLLETKTLPGVDMNVIRAGYPHQARLMDRGTVSAESLGLAGSGPWPVLLCGYLLHALDRMGSVIRQQPYTPSAENRYFKTMLAG